MAQQRLFVTREGLDQALREFILSHPDLVLDRSEKAKARHQAASDRFRHLWQSAKTPPGYLKAPAGGGAQTGAFKA